MSDTGAADLSRLHVVVPLRTLEGGKSRLGGALDAEERETLVAGMLRRLLDAVRDWGAATAVHVVSPDRALLDLAAAGRAHPVLQTDGDLNAGLRLGRDVALAGGASALLILPADLPLVTSDALGRLFDATDAAIAAGSGGAVVTIAPADARGGTNSLLLSPPDVIEPAFGPDSLELHLREAAAVGATVQLVADPALAFDLDTPEDLERMDPGQVTNLEALGEAYVLRAGAVAADHAESVPEDEDAPPTDEAVSAPRTAPTVEAASVRLPAPSDKTGSAPRTAPTDEAVSVRLPAPTVEAASVRLPAPSDKTGSAPRTAPTDEAVSAPRTAPTDEAVSAPRTAPTRPAARA